ncbi:MAG: hypothetical protein ACT4PV_15360, partial [Planctomycetaceae bacterium]
MGRIALSFTPWSIRCPACKARLRIRGWLLPVSGLAVLVGVGCALLLLRAYPRTRHHSAGCAGRSLRLSSIAVVRHYGFVVAARARPARSASVLT